MNPTTPKAHRITHAEPPDSEVAYYLKKRGRYYRPNAAGYTANVAEAGLFCKSYAESDVRATASETDPQDRVTMELARGPITAPTSIPSPVSSQDSEGTVFGRNGGVDCDTNEGPCACGAWHDRIKKCADELGGIVAAGMLGAKTPKGTFEAVIKKYFPTAELRPNQPAQEAALRLRDRIAMHEGLPDFDVEQLGIVLNLIRSELCHFRHFPAPSPGASGEVRETLRKLQDMNDALHVRLTRETDHATGWRMRAAELQNALKPFADALDEELYDKGAHDNARSGAEFSVGELRFAKKAFDATTPFLSKPAAPMLPGGEALFVAAERLYDHLLDLKNWPMKDIPDSVFVPFTDALRDYSKAPPLPGGTLVDGKDGANHAQADWKIVHHAIKMAQQYMEEGCPKGRYTWLDAPRNIAEQYAKGGRQ